MHACLCVHTCLRAHACLRAYAYVCASMRVRTCVWLCLCVSYLSCFLILTDCGLRPSEYHAKSAAQRPPSTTSYRLRSPGPHVRADGSQILTLKQSDNQIKACCVSANGMYFNPQLKKSVLIECPQITNTCPRVL